MQAQYFQEPSYHDRTDGSGQYTSPEATYEQDCTPLTYIDARSGRYFQDFVVKNAGD